MASGARDSMKLIQSFYRKEREKADADIANLRAQGKLYADTSAKVKSENEKIKKEYEILKAREGAVRAEAKYDQEYAETKSAKYDYISRKLLEAVGVGGSAFGLSKILDMLGGQKKKGKTKLRKGGSTGRRHHRTTVRGNKLIDVDTGEILRTLD